jgi:hypothetical protein
VRSPTVDLSEPCRLGGIFAATARVYARYPLLFFVLALIVVAPYELVLLAATGHGPLGHRHLAFAAGLLESLLYETLVTSLVSAFHVHAVVTIGNGGRPRLGCVMLSGLRVLPTVAAAEIMATLGILLGFLALVIPGVLLTLRWAVVAQAATLEHGGWVDALRNSAELTRGRYLRILALLFLVGLFGFAAGLLGATFDLGGDPGLPAILVGVAIDTLIASLSALTLALLYFALRAEQDRPPGEPGAGG